MSDFCENQCKCKITRAFWGKFPNYLVKNAHDGDHDIEGKFHSLAQPWTFLPLTVHLPDNLPGVMKDDAIDGDDARDDGEDDNDDDSSSSSRREEEKH